MNTTIILYPRAVSASPVSATSRLRLNGATLPRPVSRAPWGSAAALVDHPSDAPPA